MTSDDLKAADPKGLIREAYAIDGITASECRSILLDWALSLADATAAPAQAATLGQVYGPKAPDHPMTGLLAEAAAGRGAGTGRRGGRAARLGQGQAE